MRVRYEPNNVLMLPMPTEKFKLVVNILLERDLEADYDEAWEDEVYVWLYHHSMEQYYGVMKKCGVQRVEEILTMDDSRVGSGSAVRD